MYFIAYWGEKNITHVEPFHEEHSYNKALQVAIEDNLKFSAYIGECILDLSNRFDRIEVAPPKEKK